MKDILVFFSGGKDSFITACMCIEMGYHVKLISFNNGCMVAEENILDSVNRLVNRYGKDFVEYVGCCSTVGTFASLRAKLSTMDLQDVSSRYPHVCIAQLNCLHCQTAMWITGLAYCEAKDLKYIATGYKSSDKFCTGIPEYLEGMKTLCSAFGVEVITPLYNLDLADNSFERNNEMLRRGFNSSVYEPKCMLGLPVEAPNQDQVDSLIKALDYPTMLEEINHLTPILKSIKLTTKSLI